MKGISKTKAALALSLLFLAGCNSHQYSGMLMDESSDGTKYSLEERTLSVLYQEYQFIPNIPSAAVGCKKGFQRVARELGFIYGEFNYSVERNPGLSMTTCLAIGEVR